jgi:hypothetical protein
MRKTLFVLTVLFPSMVSFAQNSTGNNQPYVIIIPREQIYNTAPAAVAPAAAAASVPAAPAVAPVAKPSPPPPPRYYDLSFKFSPTISSNYVEGTNEFLPMIDNGRAGRITLGPVVDVFFVDYKYALSTGIWYTVKSVGFLGPNVIKSAYSESQISQKVASNYNVQYIQIPLSAKFVSASIMRSFSCYVNFGGVFDYKIAEKPLYRDNNTLYKYLSTTGQPELFRTTNFGLLLGGGIYRRINSQNSLMLGVSYSRDLFNAVKDPNLISRSSLFSFDIGMIF